ncbi:MAG TPA: S46 family peptidase [Prolixibacteraceae bacterium]|nr:S46 family peptidase [Prolixibacteraceae bacterium]HPS11688.1 S46 family peptidase [Prolixibacteraceae bacterium]
MRHRIYALIAAAFFAVGQASADEGMWLPSFLSEINVQKMQKMGSELTAEDIFNINSSSLKDAVIVLDGGSCTGELVSPDGLFLTNHHCGYGEIQEHSSVENDILKNGFWAKNRKEELSNPGKTVSFLIRVEDVTDTILTKLTPEMNEDTRRDSIRAISSRLESAAEEGTDYDAEVNDLFESNRYYLFVYETFRDVRLVAAPPQSVGKFGGDTDNWMWPRHTGDFSIFRIYTDPNGKPAEYSENNIPLKSRHFLPVSLEGYQDGDFAMVMGYPGSTNRYLTSEGVNYVMNVVNDARIKVRKEKLDILANYMNTGEKATIQYASKYARSSNYYKFSIGQNRGLTRLNVVEKKRATENQFLSWVNADENRKKEYGETLKMISDAYIHTDDNKAVQYIAEAFLRGPEIFQYANRFSDLQMNLKQNLGKDAVARSVNSLKEKLNDYYKDYDAATDQKLVAALTKVFVENVSPVYYPEFVKTIKGKYQGDYDRWAADLFRKSIFDEKEKVEAFLSKPKLAVLANDPAYKISGQIYDSYRKAIKENETDHTNLGKGYRLYLKGLMEMEPETQFYPNANSTMRLTFGKVGDYDPAEAVHYDYFTTLKGYVEKEIPGDWEFDVSPRLKELYYAKDYGEYADKDGTLHTCFISNNDITGGNSGSPVINGKGELIGIAFDGNWEAMSGDIAFEPDLQRCINVDIRFVLWMIDKFAGDKQLIDEMTIVK